MKLRTPELTWQTSLCPVCGATYQWLTKKPKTCKSFTCTYNYKYKIDVHLWANPPARLRKLAKREAM